MYRSSIGTKLAVRRHAFSAEHKLEVFSACQWPFGLAAPVVLAYYYGAGAVTESRRYLCALPITLYSSLFRPNMSDRAKRSPAATPAGRGRCVYSTALVAYNLYALYLAICFTRHSGAYRQ